MYILNKPFAILGIAIAALSTVMTPFLKVPLVGNWNMYESDIFLFSITLGILILAIFFFALRKASLFRWTAIVFFVWCVLGFVMVYFKINNYFGMKLVDSLLSKTVHLRWGWFFLFLGAIVMLLSVRKLKEVKAEQAI